MECLSYCIANTINLPLIERYLKKMGTYQWHRYWNTIEISSPDLKQYCYIFKNGTLVCWNFKRYEVKKLFAIVKAAGTTLFKRPPRDAFSYCIKETTRIFPHKFFNVDCMTLEQQDPELMLALSYGLSQSIKLNYYEHLLDVIINKYTPLIQQVSESGYFSIPRRQVLKIIGEMLTTKSEINLTSNFLYVPKFFWQHANLEPYYVMLDKYLDISTRADSLNQQLDTLHEIFIMFNSYLENRHSHILEVTIVVLIALEIIFTTFFHYF
jgi:required for meiotic nuclear division protein 1